MESSVQARRVRFSSAHFYKQEKFSDAENRATFGACYTPYGHGHNYVLEVLVNGSAPAGDLDRVLREVVAELDHHHLNFDVAAFRERGGAVPTTENIALYLRARLIERWQGTRLRLQRVRLYETDDLWVEVEG